MRRWSLLVVLALSACDWDDAERRARCTRAPTTAGCEVVEPDAGVDGGEATPDAGPAVDAGRGTSYESNGAAAPVGLYPTSTGGLWVVGNLGTEPLVERRDALGGFIRREVGLGVGRVASAYADGVSSPWLVMVRANGGPLHLISESGVSQSTARPGNFVSMYLTPGGTPMASVWMADGVTYRQTLVPPDDLSAATALQSVPCEVTFVDLEVQRPGAADRVAIVYDASECRDAGTTDARGVDSNTIGGVQTITAPGARDRFDLGAGVRRVGRWDAGFVFMSQPTAGRLKLDYFGWSADGGVAGGVASFSADAGLAPGDVYEDLAAMTTAGTLTWDGANRDVDRDGTLQLSVVNTSARWLVPFGSVAGPEVALLTTGDTAWVLWSPADGGLQLTALDLATGVAR